MVGGGAAAAGVGVGVAAGIGTRGRLGTLEKLSPCVVCCSMLPDGGRITGSGSGLSPDDDGPGCCCSLLPNCCHGFGIDGSDSRPPSVNVTRAIGASLQSNPALAALVLRVGTFAALRGGALGRDAWIERAGIGVVQRPDRRVADIAPL